jgi:uncharacterized protein (DUF934 family)
MVADQPPGAASLRFRDDPGVEEPGVTLDAFLDQPAASAVRIEPGEDVRRLAPVLGRVRLVEISFPTFRDGRGYSAARILRDELGYTGELRAQGDVLVDQLWFMRRCGFDSFAPEKPLDAAAVERALKRYGFVYQSAADSRPAVWKLRHG